MFEHAYTKNDKETDLPRKEESQYPLGFQYLVLTPYFR